MMYDPSTFDPRCPIDFGPRQVPSMRDHMISTWSPGGMSRRLELMLRATQRSKTTTPIDTTALIRQDSLKRSTLYWVTADMCDLLDSCRSQVPLDITLTSDLVPDARRGYGLAFFEQGMTGLESYGEHRGEPSLVVDAIHWHPVMRTDPNGTTYAELNIDSYSHTNVSALRMHSCGGSEWGLRRRIDEWTSGETCDNPSVIEDRQLLVAFFGLLSSPGVTEERRLAPSPNKKARHREGDVGAVRLIYLRGSQVHLGNGGSGREYHHRWVVSGHWRSQPHGPGLTLRRPVWIRPHVKGPEGAPLLTGDKVHVV